MNFVDYFYFCKNSLHTMPRPPAASDSILARVRAWFGLHLAELALYLGVSKALAHAIESGRRPLTPAVRTALLPLLLQLPPPEVPATSSAALPPTTPLPDAADLDSRRRECLRRAARLLAEADAITQQAHVAARWAAALPGLLPSDPETPERPIPNTLAGQALAAALALAADPDDPARAPTHARWLRGWLYSRAQPPPSADITRLHRLRAQAAGLLAEAAALATVLLPPPALEI